MFKTPTEYAKQMLDLFYGDHEAALTELYNASRSHPQVPCRFFRDVAKALEDDKHAKSTNRLCFVSFPERMTNDHE